MLHSVNSPIGNVSPSPVDEDFTDFALLFGITNRSRYLFVTAAAGLSKIDYTKSGNANPSNDPSPVTYQKITGSNMGIACGFNAYLTPFPFWGIWGLGIYGSFTKNVSYFVVELSLIELNLPLSLASLPVLPQR